MDRVKVCGEDTGGRVATPKPAPGFDQGQHSSVEALIVEDAAPYAC
ncbi:MAG: hypothetical protein OXR07_02465 [Nitrospira sp.]|nr:hypothetical protein [Nitrospira sp.]